MQGLKLGEGGRALQGKLFARAVLKSCCLVCPSTNDYCVAHR